MILAFTESTYPIVSAPACTNMLFFGYSQYTVLYHGSKEDREVIESTEFFLRPCGKKGRRCKFDVLIMAYDTLRRSSRSFFDITWEAVVVDEAHKLKSTKSQIRRLVADLQQKWFLLLTGV